jgi:hypothetical protein
MIERLRYKSNVVEDSVRRSPVMFTGQQKRKKIQNNVSLELWNANQMVMKSPSFDENGRKI